MKKLKTFFAKSNVRDVKKKFLLLSLPPLSTPQPPKKIVARFHVRWRYIIMMVMMMMMMMMMM